MTARDVIEANEALQGACRKHASAHSPLVVADNIVRDLSTAGFVIMSKADVEAVREALEPFANRAFQFDGADDDWFCNPSLQVKHLRTAAAAIRSLKSGERDE